MGEGKEGGSSSRDSKIASTVMTMITARQRFNSDWERKNCPLLRTILQLFKSCHVSED